MKKRWEEPRILVQKFMPNEYVAACGDSGVVYNFECNAGNRRNSYNVYFDDGKIVRYDVTPFLEEGIFRKLKDLQVFINACTILNGTLAWDIAGNRNEQECIDIDPETLHALPDASERIA